MRKVLATITVGARYARVHDALFPLRNAWAARHGWDVARVTHLPDGFVERHGRAHGGYGFLCNLYKLQLPRDYRAYDVVAYADADIAFNPRAPCLSTYLEKVPRGGFAGVQTVRHEERPRLFPHWNTFYYDDLRELGFRGSVPDPARYVNGGLLLFRPSEVEERWQALLHQSSDLNEEHRLNVHELQSGRCFVLPERWNVMWRYERYRSGIERPKASRVARGATRALWRIPPMRAREYRRLVETFGTAHAVHFAGEHERALAFGASLRRDLS